MKKIIYKKESYNIIGSCMEVHNELGAGFLEAVYQEALEIELESKNIPFDREKELLITFKDQVLEKKYYADFICYDKIILEIKALNSLTSEHESQLLNYLKASQYKLGILINFGGTKLKYKRMVL